MIIIIRLTGDAIATGKKTTLNEARLWAAKIYEVTAMADKNENNNSKQCVEACDKKFIECVESSRQDCLSRFGSCSSSCKV